LLIYCRGREREIKKERGRKEGGEEEGRKSSFIVGLISEAKEEALRVHHCNNNNQLLIKEVTGEKKERPSHRYIFYPGEKKPTFRSLLIENV
jgi:hypothetical protein